MVYIHIQVAFQPSFLDIVQTFSTFYSAYATETFFFPVRPGIMVVMFNLFIGLREWVAAVVRVPQLCSRANSLLCIQWLRALWSSA